LTEVDVEDVDVDCAVADKDAAETTTATLIATNNHLDVRVLVLFEEEKDGLSIYNEDNKMKSND